MTGADVLLLPGEPDPSVVRLMIFEVPAARALTRRQNNGDECVWCSAAEGLPPLCGPSAWRPHGCAPCRQIRVTYLRAYLAWKGHAQDCEPCRTEWCPDGWGLALAHGIAYEVAGKEEPVYCACGCPLSRTSRRLRPYVTDCLTGPRYSHTGPCTNPGAPASADEGTRR
ncbi:hypothetical protein [Streptomyces sp. NPDC101776]|uniref:hypothetical protein n=1 Tax=Streptomyces sp. NPDC101776 TaxID=3366146 RepID=UPI00380824D8